MVTRECSRKFRLCQKSLVRGLSLLDATTIVVGSMIGSGIFIVSSESARLVGAPGWLLLAWLLAGTMTISGALCFGELAAMMPRAGGPYVFMTEAYGQPGRFSLWLVAIPDRPKRHDRRRRRRICKFHRHPDAADLRRRITLSSRSFLVRTRSAFRISNFSRSRASPC